MVTYGQIVGTASIIGIFGLAELRNQVRSTSSAADRLNAILSSGPLQ